jgi:hypothetical protein
MKLPAFLKMILPTTGTTLSIKDVFIEALNFRWEEYSNDVFWSRSF